MILKRFYSNSIIEFNLSGDIKTIPVNLEKSVDFEDINNISGIYDVLSNEVYSVFTFKNSNYIFLKNQTLEINESIDFEYNVNWKKGDLSYFEVFKNSKSIIKIEYFNKRSPLINPFDGHEDWLYINWGYHLSTYIEKIKKNPKLLLFPSINDDSPS